MPELDRCYVDCPECRREVVFEEDRALGLRPEQVALLAGWSATPAITPDGVRTTLWLCPQCHRRPRDP